MIGTASRVRRYLLLETPGPWGVEALRDSRLPQDFKSELRRRSQAAGVRVLLIRRFGRARSRTASQVFVIDTDPVRPSAATTQVTDLREVLNLDIWGRVPGAAGENGGLSVSTGSLASPASSTPGPRLQLHEQPIFLVCTHGRHDPCCAERGRPLARALTEAFPEQTWESSHMGGDRFAGNLLCLPHGISYGRVTPDTAEAVASEYTKGRLDLVHLRGRGAYPFAAQVADWALRNRLGVVGLDDVALVEHRLTGGDAVAVFEVAPADRWAVRVRVGRAAPHRLTCHAVAPFAAPQFEVLAIDPL